MSYEPDAPYGTASGGSAREEIPEARAREAAADLKSKASGVGAEAAETMARARAAAAGGIDSAASALHEGAEALASGSRVRSGANKAADALVTSAEYIRGHDVGAMVDDLLGVVRKNPGPALLGAAALGYLVGRAFSRD
jgi:hypothetical protein